MPDVKQTISDFYRVAQEKDFSRDFQFRVLNINPGAGSDQEITEDDLVYAKGGSIPARTIASSDVPYMGLNFKVPGAASYPGEYSISFHCDNASKIRQLFENWSTDIFNDKNSTGNYFVPRATAVIDLLQLNSQLDAVAHYQLVGAFPTSVGEIAYDIGGAGATTSFDCTLAYHFWNRLSPE
jgi:hypothetical protein